MKGTPDPVGLSIFANRLASICDEMGAVLRNAAFSPMTNTRNTPVEVLESRYPLRIKRYAIRRGSDGAGAQRGGEGLLREFAFLAPAQPDVNRLNGQEITGKCEREVAAGDRLVVESPGGGWGKR